MEENGSPLGLLLLTGGQGRRLGGPKHARPHPAGGTWGGHLVRVFRQVFPGGSVRILGEPLPDAEGVVVPDPRQGPAVALTVWAGSEPSCILSSVRRWWVLPCDQVQWTPEDLVSWLAVAQDVDPEGRAWVMVREESRDQPLGGFLGAALMPVLASLKECRVRDLLQHLPRCVVACDAYRGLDVDFPADLERWNKVCLDAGRV